MFCVISADVCEGTGHMADPVLPRIVLARSQSPAGHGGGET